MKSCESCGGARKVLGMGGMKVNCPACRGTGIAASATVVANAIANGGGVVKRRGRPPADKSEG